MNPNRRVLPETDFAEHYRRHMRRVGYRPKPSSEWDAKAPALNRREGGESRYIRALLAAIDWPQNGTLLDVGCGTGALALAAAGRCRHVYCLDYSPVMLQTLEQNACAAGIANYSTFLLDKNADWPQVPRCDTVVCSRAGLDHDLAALFAKLSKHAAKQVISAKSSAAVSTCRKSPPCSAATAKPSPTTLFPPISCTKWATTPKSALSAAKAAGRTAKTGRTFRLPSPPNTAA